MSIKESGNVRVDGAWIRWDVSSEVYGYLDIHIDPILMNSLVFGSESASLKQMAEKALARWDEVYQSTCAALLALIRSAEET